MSDRLRNPAQLALIEARHVNRLAEALLIAASEYAEEQRLSQGAVLGSFGVALGRVTGEIAREGEESLSGLLDYVLRHVRRTAHLEFGRRAWTLQ